jgi:hypothetical protein
MTNSQIPTIQQLQRGIAIAEQIQKLEAELAGILGGSPEKLATRKAPSAPASGGKVRRKNRLSREARERIAAAQRARWAKVKAKKSPAKAAKPAKKKRKLTPAGRARLAALMKARWAARKAAGAPAPNKKAS